MKDVAVHDHSYKLLFSHARMVRDLLEGFVGGEWLRAVDFSTLERVSDAYVTDDLRARADDIIWRVRCGARYVYLLVEFQSRPEPFMAVRVLTYVGLLYQDLIKAQQVRRGELLPNVLPVVLYNGTTRWRAAEDMSSLLCESCDELEKYRASLRYLLIDEGAYDCAQLARSGNLLAILIQIENCFRREQLSDLVCRLIAHLQDETLRGLQRAFAIWLDRVVFIRFSDERIFFNKLWETERMLADRVPIWEEELREEGRVQGREQGLQQGEARLLMRQLQKRFGELPAALLARLRSATSEQLEAWGERLIDVTSLNELFSPESAS